jgi:hypothetical protein
VPVPLELSAAARRAFDRMADDLARVLDGRLVAVVATGPATSVVFAGPIGPGDLLALGAIVEAWHRDGLETPLLLTPEEFRRSLDTFAAEYQAIIDRHLVIRGVAPFGDATISTAALRHACEVQAKGHLIHLRQGWLESAGDAARLADLLVRSAGPLRTLLANVARLAGAPDRGEDAALIGARLAGLSEPLIRDVLALDEAPEKGPRCLPMLPDYLAASEQLWAFVDTWRSAS